MNRAALPNEAQRCIRRTVRFFEGVVEDGGFSSNYMMEAHDDMREVAKLIADVGSVEQVHAVNVVLNIIGQEGVFGIPWGYCIRVLKCVVGDQPWNGYRSV